MAVAEVRGLKVIADALSRIWRHSVTLWGVARYMRRKRDPLPLGGPRYTRKAITRRALVTWARRNERSLPQVAQSDPRQLCWPLPRKSRKT